MARELLVRLWTDIDRDQLKKLFAEGWSVKLIARRLKRSDSAVRREMMLLRLSVREREAGRAAAIQPADADAPTQIPSCQ
jgi:hypothetical protein